MASLLISAALNIGVGLALNALFPPPDINQEGPRLTNLDVTSSAYGQPINIIFGTDRVGGNIIWALPIIEEANTQSSTVGKGGGQDVNQTSYTYFATFDIAFALSGAQTVLRIWADGKLIYDTTGDSPALKKNGTVFSFYSGGPTQGKDPVEVAELGEANTPAYRHLTRLVFDRLPLADFGNRIANLTAEISYDADFIAPFTLLDEFGALDIPGSSTGSDTSKMFVDTDRGIFGSLKAGDGLWTASINDDPMTVKNWANTLVGASEANYGFGFFVGQNGGSNAEPINIVNADSGVTTDTFGQDSTLGSESDVDAFRNDGQWSVLRTGDPLLGFRFWAFKSSIFSDDGSLIEFDMAGRLVRTAPGGVPFKAAIFGEAIIKDFDTVRWVPDDDRGSGKQVMYFIGDKLDGNVQVGEVNVKTSIPDVANGTYSGITVTETGTFNWASGSRALNGWAVNQDTGHLLLSNGSSTVVYDPEADQVLVEREGLVINGENNYLSGDMFAVTTGGSTDGTTTVIDPRTLETRFTIDNGLWAAVLSGGEQVAPESVVWNPLRQSLIFSREQGASDQPSAGERVIQVFVGRAQPAPIDLGNDVMTPILTSYNGMTMANLPTDAFDVTPLVGIPILGFNINRPSAINTAIDILRRAYFFDGVESDWMMKWPVRGGSSVVTIPEEDVGQLNIGSEEEPVQEIRTQEADIPMRLNFRFRNRQADYSQDIEHAKRQISPVPSMFSADEKTFDVPVVFDGGTEPKQAVEKWLFTAWNERKQFKTIIPWTYLQLDPTDVFQMGVFGETLQLRMAEQDVGSSLATEIIGVREQAFQFASTGQGAAVLGQITRQVPGTMPAALINLDAPTLDASHLSDGTFFNAYVAMTSFDTTWPGGSVMKSADNLNYSSVATGTGQAAWGFITTAPGGWGEQDSGNLNFRNRPQEVADGGTMRIQPANRPEFYASATELDWYGGANGMAVITSGGVEIVQFQTATPTGEGDELDVSRLLRGRLGTEDVVDAFPIQAGDMYVMLSDELANPEINITLARLPLSEMDVNLFWKGVTIGTQLEDAPTTSFTYTGRDLLPYSPTGISATGDGSGGLDVSWLNRTRTSGEWLDGTGDVNLNETIERYRVDLSTVGLGVFITKTVDDVRTVNFTEAELLPAQTGQTTVARQVWPNNGEFQSGDLTSWTIQSGTWSVVTSGLGLVGPPPVTGPNAPAESNFARQTAANQTNAEIRNLIDFTTEFGINTSNIVGAVVRTQAWMGIAGSDGFGQDAVRAILGTVNSVGGQLQSVDTGNISDETVPGNGWPFNDTWFQVGLLDDPTIADPDNPGFSLSLGITDPTTTGAHFRFLNSQEAFTNEGNGFDFVEFEYVGLPPAITATIVQISGTGKESPIGRRLIT
jgi:hypothetical protein